MLEQLSFLYHGLKIRVHETKYEVLGIDLPRASCCRRKTYTIRKKYGELLWQNLFIELILDL
jgi:hypothetical protein